MIELPVEARTSQQAADAVGVGVGQIAKSLVFMVDGDPVMVIASGVNRVDERKLASLAGGKVRRADADTVKKATGYTIGGVPPFGHDTALRLWIGMDLLAATAIDGIRPRKSGSHWTRCWRKTDSNCRFPLRWSVFPNRLFPPL